jgi:hypothetical protein
MSWAVAPLARDPMIPTMPHMAGSLTRPAAATPKKGWTASHRAALRLGCSLELYMATPADQRLLELLDKWLKSLELHLKYSSLDDDSYSQIQPWPAHQRPSRWIIDLAKQKAADLQTQVQDRVQRGDTTFSDSLELMTFLANLVGAEHIERFIPLANADTERTAAPTAADDRPLSPSDNATGTREMPRFLDHTSRAPAPSGTDRVARTERQAADAKPVAKAALTPSAEPSAPYKQAPATPGSLKGASAAKAPDHASKPDRPLASEAMLEQVIADAVRLVQWGRKWYELAELISSMADRPPLTDVRRMLKDNKTVIDKKAGRG